MEIEKLQNFLRNRYKFEPKKDEDQIIEEFKVEIDKVNALIKKKDMEKLDVAIGKFLIDLLRACNTFNIDLGKTLKEKLQYGL